MVLAALPVVVAALILSPVLATGFYGDDASDANLNGALAYQRTSLPAMALATAALWMHANGRLFPLYVFEKYAVFHVFPDVGVYKGFLVLLTVLDVVAFLLFVRAQTGFVVAVLCGLLAALSLQMRGYHDPLYAYNGMIQIMFLVLLASLWCWGAYLAGRGTAFGAAALALYLANGLTYEFSYLFFPLYATLSTRRGMSAALHAMLPFAAITLALALASAILRGHATIAPESAYAFGTGASGYTVTLARQLTAALPLSYYLWNPSRIFPPPGNLLDPSPDFHVSLAAAGTIAFAAYVVLERFARERPSIGARATERLAALGVGLWVLPAALVAASAKYQRELAWGIGYLPVLIECFGVAILLALTLGAVVNLARARRIERPALVALALCCGFAGAITLADNRRLAAEIAPWRDSRAVVEEALAAGVARGLPDGSTLIVARGLPWLCFAERGCPDDLDARYFVYANAGKRVDVRPEEAAPRPAGGNAYLLHYGAARQLAAVAVSHLASPGPSGVGNWATAATAATKGATLIYVRRLSGANCRLRTIGSPSGGTTRVPASILAAGANWALFSAAPSPGPGDRLGSVSSFETGCGRVPLTPPRGAGRKEG